MMIDDNRLYICTHMCHWPSSFPCFTLVYHSPPDGFLRAPGRLLHVKFGASSKPHGPPARENDPFSSMIHLLKWGNSQIASCWFTRG